MQFSGNRLRFHTILNASMLARLRQHGMPLRSIPIPVDVSVAGGGTWPA